MKRYYLVKYVINFSGRLQSITATQISTLDLLESEKDIEKRLWKVDTASEKELNFETHLLRFFRCGQTSTDFTKIHQSKSSISSVLQELSCNLSNNSCASASRTFSVTSFVYEKEQDGEQTHSCSKPFIPELVSSFFTPFTTNKYVAQWRQRIFVSFYFVWSFVF